MFSITIAFPTTDKADDFINHMERESRCSINHNAKTNVVTVKESNQGGSCPSDIAYDVREWLLKNQM